MDQAQVFESLSEEVKCTVCLELFEDPRLLCCGHTFCLSCLSQLAVKSKGKNVECPMCRAIHKLDKNGVQALCKNRYVANIVEKLVQTQKAAENVPFPYHLYTNDTSGSKTEESGQGNKPQGNFGIYSLYASTLNPSAPPNFDQNTYEPNPQMPEVDDTSPIAPPSAPTVPSSSAPPPADYPCLIDDSDLSPSIYPAVPPPSTSTTTQPHDINNNNNNANSRPTRTNSVQYPPPVQTKDGVPIYNYPYNPQYPTDSLYNAQAAYTVPPPQQQPQAPVPPPEPEEQPGFINSVFKFFKGFTEPSKPSPAIDPNLPFFAPFDQQLSQVHPQFVKWLNTLWFAPSDFSQKVRLGPISAHYIPFWDFDVSTQSSYVAEVARFEKQTADSNKRVEKWVSITGVQTGHYTSVLVYSDVEQPQAITELLKLMLDWLPLRAKYQQPQHCSPTNQLMPRIDRAETHERAWTECAATVTQKEQENCPKKIKREENTEKLRDFKINVHFVGASKKLIFLPVFVGTYEYEKKDYHFVLNAQTGTVQAQRPYGLGRIGSIGKASADFVGSLLFGQKK